MPNYIKYVRASTGQTAPLAEVDEEICAHLGIEVDPVHWCYGWFDSIGLLHSMGKSQDEILAVLAPTPTDSMSDIHGLAQLSSITNYIHAYYTPQAWYRPR
jgi:hypothetical protein